MTDQTEKNRRACVAVGWYITDDPEHPDSTEWVVLATRQVKLPTMHLDDAAAIALLRATGRKWQIMLYPDGGASVSSGSARATDETLGLAAVDAVLAWAASKPPNRASPATPGNGIDLQKSANMNETDYQPNGQGADTQ